MKQHIGIFGPGQSGKTTLAKVVIKAMEKEGYDALAIDLNDEYGGGKIETFQDEELFWKKVYSTTRKLIIVEEATETIARSQELIPVFTRIRHRGHKLLIVGHSGTNLLPIMREQIHFLHLFRQSPQAAAIWAETFADERIMLSTTLAQYQFLRCVNFGDGKGQHLIEKRHLTFKKK